MIILFWLISFLIVYTYVGYPIFLRVLNKVIKTKPVDKKEIYPHITFIIPAYNEAGSIADKLNNVLSLDYPKDKLDIIVASDCSTDRTDDITRSFSDRGVILSRLEKHEGKIAGYRQAVNLSKGEILVFSDATSFIERKSLKALARNFNDERIGCVGGLLQYYDPKVDHVGLGEQTYWSYESRIKSYESSISSLTSVSGTFYAVRKEYYPIDMPNDLADDLVVPLNVVKHGKKVVLEPDAVCKEETVVNDAQETRKRYRITVQNIRGLLAHAYMLNIFKYGVYAFMLISHKLCRLLSPFFLFGLLLVSVLLSDNILILLFLIGQIVFYMLGLISHFTHIKNPKIINSVHYFCLSNFAIFIGFVNFFKGEKVATWETAR